MPRSATARSSSRKSIPSPSPPAEDEAIGQRAFRRADRHAARRSISASSAPTRIDGKEVIPFFSQDREPYLEYDLTSLIYRLSTPKKPMVGVISSLPLDTGAGGMAGGAAGPRAALHDL